MDVKELRAQSANDLNKELLRQLESRFKLRLQKATYLHKMTSGEWTGTMCLTEPHCGTDLGLMRTKAEPQPDGTYRLTGNKIFISAGEHDMAANIIHLVLARLPDAPAGIKGVSLFIVPKFRVNKDGTPGERNWCFDSPCRSACCR